MTNKDQKTLAFFLQNQWLRKEVLKPIYSESQPSFGQTTFDRQTIGRKANIYFGRQTFGQLSFGRQTAMPYVSW
jgi:hypothetical protein